MSSLTPDDAAYEVVPAPPVLSVELVEQTSAALAVLSNAIYEALPGERGYRENLLWADAAVDRAMGDLLKIRQWLEG